MLIKDLPKWLLTLILIPIILMSNSILEQIRWEAYIKKHKLPKWLRWV